VGVQRPIGGGIHGELKERDDCGMYVTGHIGRFTIEMLIDSGANISLVNHAIYERLRPHGRPPLRRYATPMVTADGTPMRVYGCATFDLRVGEDSGTYSHKMCVADVGVDMIMGYDFLRKYEAVLDFGGGSLTLRDAEDPQEDVASGTGGGRCKVVVSRTITVPAGQEAIVQGKCVGTFNEFTGLMEPLEKFKQKHCMLVAHAAVTAGPKGVPVRVFNVSDSAVTLYKNTAVAECTSAEVMHVGDGDLDSLDARGSEEGSMEVPEHVRRMFEEGCMELPERDQLRLAALLREYGDVFSAHGLDMGRTGLIQHRIDMQGTHPIKQRLR
jgi:hypothetical protein